MALNHRQSSRRTAARLFAAYLAFAVGLCAFPAERPTASTSEPVTDPRILAAEVVYTAATADDWGQRAVIARTALNAIESGVSPLRHLGNGRERLDDGFDPYLWQASLDAVDAVQSGSYAIPDACSRADTVLSDIQRESEPPLLRADSAREQCVLGGLTFVVSR